jgi:signal transduction histidine kinase
MQGPTRSFQIAALLLLFVCFAQATWWILEETRFTREVQRATESLYAADAVAGEELLAAGVPPERIEELFPHVAVRPEGVEVRREALAALAEERRHRLNRFGWEGSFFLVVLLAGMGVIVQALRMSTELVRRQQNFLASVSHELKSPLASMRLSAETLLVRKPDPATVDRLAGRILRDADRLGLLITNLLEVARLEEGEVRFQPSREPMRPLVEAAARELEAELEGLDLALEVPPELCVFADPEAYRACVRNLLSNAAKSVRAAGTRRVHVSARPAGSAVVLAVKDDGLGFDPREAKRLFGKFYRPGDEMRRRTQGSGLGLYIVQNFARRHGGDAAGASAGPGSGAEFTLRWPAEGRGA